LFHLLRRLRDEGKSVVLVTHKLREVMAVTDRVSVMRQGRIVAGFATADTSASQLAEAMVGRPVLLRVEKRPASRGEPLLQVRDLRTVDARGVTRLRGVSFDVCAGEIVGIAGVSGNGQSELLDAIAGLCEIAGGEVRLSGRNVSGEKLDAAHRRDLGLAHVPEDRLLRGVVGTFSAEDNLVLGYQDRSEFQRVGVLRRGEIRRVCETRMVEHDIRPPVPTLPITAFSGGNQQKLVLARETEMKPQILLVGQPTRGVDIGAIEAIHRRLVALRDAGKALLLVSVELEEILALADRILVMHDGEIAGELTPAEATEERLGLLMAGVKPGVAHE
jgi:simple sugar transport system ATP-binding protein